MTKRLKEIFSIIPNCHTFADIGCDHGYIAKGMLDLNKCSHAIVSDVSAKCLKKAENLLKDYISAGKVSAVVSDGFEKVGKTDVALIAGMGGEEIIKIVQNAVILPNVLVLQPMKNCDKVRVELRKTGYKFEKDYVFKAEDKFYDLMLLTRGDDVLTQEEIYFGRTNLQEKGNAFKERLSIEKRKFENLIKGGNLSDVSKEEFEEKIRRIDNLCIL